MCLSGKIHVQLSRFVVEMAQRVVQGMATTQYWSNGSKVRSELRVHHVKEAMPMRSHRDSLIDPWEFHVALRNDLVGWKI